MVHNLKIQDISQVSRFRSTTAQLIACMAPNLLLLDLGMAVAFPTIAVPDLLNASEGLSLNDSQASWFSSISFLAQPLGALISGPIVDFFGRKKANVLVNIPHVIAWILMYFSWSLPTLFIANALLGFGTGIMEAPINAYVGEVSEPSVRGALCTLTVTFNGLGTLAMFFLGTVVNWRDAALISLAAPVASMLFCIFAPETPVWLLSKGREKDAMKSLCYLRGWTSVDNVKEEFDQLAVYTKKLQQCPICAKMGKHETEECEHKKMNIFKRSLLKFRCVMLGKETLRPFIFIMLYFLFFAMSGFVPVRSNMANVCEALGMKDNGKRIVLMVGVITFFATFAVVGLIKMLGKRKLAINAMIGTALSCTALSIYARYNLADTVFSYDTSTFPTEKSVVPLIFFYAMIMFTGFGIPWVLLGEVFPFRSRASAQGIAAALYYLVMFVAAKTFIDIEIHLKLWGAFAIYAIFGFIGAIHLYFYLPETEGKTLEEIETFFNGKKSKIFADDLVFNFFKRLAGNDNENKDKPISSNDKTYI